MMADTNSVLSEPELNNTESELNDGYKFSSEDKVPDTVLQVENGHLNDCNEHDSIKTVKNNEENSISSEKTNKEPYQSSTNGIPMQEVPLKSYDSSKNGDILPEEEEEDPDTICGFGSFRPKWLQPWATAKVYLSLHSIIGVVSGTYYAYRIGVMSTLEKRFAFKSKTTGAIMIFDEITPLFFGALVGYFGGKMHRPRILGLGVFLSVICCWLSALPYLIYGPAKQFGDTFSVQGSNVSSLEQCNGAKRGDHCEVDDRPPTVMAVLMWMVAGILKGFGNLSYYSIGLSYLDDNSKKKNTPMYFAIAFVLRLFGPLLGFLMSSICLKFFENPFDDPGYGPDDPRWIGAWWIGFVLEGFLLLLVAIPVSMFPKRLPGMHKYAHKNDAEKANFKGMLTALKRILLNPLLMAVILNDIVSIYGTVGHHVMLPKYMEHQFRLTASDASLYSGVPGIGAVMVAVTLGGYLIWKFRPTLKFLLGAMVVSEIIGALGFVAMMIPKCEKLEMANFGINNEGLILTGECNANCSCSTKSFTPACGSDGTTLYFSPCHAGCTHTLNNTFYNCSCSMNTGAPHPDFITEGFCMSESCWLQALAYIIAWPTIQFIVSILRVMQKLMLLRCTQPQDKSLALGVFEGITCVLGFVPYLIIFGAMVDSVCLVWESSCGETGNCWFYDTDKFSNILHGMSAGFSFLSVFTMLLIYKLRDRFYDLYDDDFEADMGLKKQEKTLKKDGQEMKPINK